MPDYSLGRAHGRIDIDYDGKGADEAEADLRGVAAASADADKSLTKTNKTLAETERSYDSAGTSAAGYQQRLRDVASSARDVEVAEKNRRATLLDAKATLDDIKASEQALTEAKNRHAAANAALTASEAARIESMSTLAQILPRLNIGLDGWVDRLSSAAEASGNAADKGNKLSQALSMVARGAMLAGRPDVAAGFEGVAVGIDTITAAATAAIGAFKAMVGFEVEFAKISGAVLGATSLGGLAGLAGSSSIMGLVQMADSVRQLSGALGLLPAVISGVTFSAQTLEVAFHGVGDAITDMMADDPKKFLEDIKNMGPIAAQAMLDIAQFRDAIRFAEGAIQDSFFAQIAADIAPLIQTWLPAVSSAMSQVAGIFGQAAHQLAQLLMQPQAMATFQRFVDDISAGLQAMIPALDPLLYMFEQLTVAGSGFFEQIGGVLTQTLGNLADIIQAAASSGALQNWIQAGINGFIHLGNIVFNLGSAFGTIMDVAERFGGGGLLGWLEEVTSALAGWAESTDGQKSLTEFFTLMRQATDAFLPMLPPLLSGLASIGSAFAQLGVATAPGWQAVFDTFAQVMAQLGPQIAATAPSINAFLTGLAKAFADLMGKVGPLLPQIFHDLASAFVTLLPQLGPLTDAFLALVTQVGPQLPKLFASFTALLQALMPYLPVIIELIREFVTVITFLIQAVTMTINAFTQFLEWIGQLAESFGELMGKVPGALKEAFSQVGSFLKEIFGNLINDAEDWGKNLLKNLAKGLMDSLGVDAVRNAAKTVAEIISDFWKTKSPAAQGPLHDMSPNQMGVNVVRNFAAGITAAHPAVAAAAGGAAGAVVGALSGSGAAPAPGGRSTAGGSLLPDHIASADTSILTAYLRHEFSDRHGLKGLAKDLGDALQVVQGGFNLVTQQGITPMLQALGMIPGLNDRGWRKMTPAEMQAESARKSQSDAKKGPTWADVFGPDTSSDGATAGPTLPGASVPLVQNPDGTWTSPNAAWAHLINRESGGVNQRQKIIDANSGGNEAEGIFQITPQTWRAHGGSEFAANPLAASVQQQALIAARILQRNPSGSDWGAGLPGREDAAALLAGLTGSPPPGAKGPTWVQLSGASNAAAAAAAIAGGAGAAQGGYPGDAAFLADVPSGRYVRPEDGLDWDLAKGLADCSSAVEDLTAKMDGRPTGGRSLSTHNADQWLLDHGFLPTDKLVPGAFNVGFNDSHMQATLPGGTNFNWGSDAAAAARGINGTGAFDPAFTSHYYRLVTGGSPGVGGAVNAGLTLPSGKTLEELTNKNLNVNEQLLQAYLQGNPALAQQILAAQTPGADDKTVVDTLGNISSTITTLQNQDAVGNKGTIDALRDTQGKLAQQQGFVQNQQGPIDAVSSIVGSAGNAVTSVFQAVKSGLDALGATQDIADRLVYGIRNTEDINKIVDNVQKYISFAADIANASGQILSSIGSIVGAGAGADPTGGASGAAAGLQTAGQIASLVSGVLQGVNATIDFAQQVYDITMSYAGRFMSYLTGLGGTQLMGNVGFLLNKNTGQLISYSQDNPEQKNVAQVPSWMRYFYDYNGRGNANPGVGQMVIYASPGQSPGEMMNEVSWLVRTGGTTGALSAAAF